MSLLESKESPVLLSESLGVSSRNGLVYFGMVRFGEV